MEKLSLQDMVSDMRHELGHTANVAAGVGTADRLKYYLRRTQKELYQNFDWPELNIQDTVPFTAGTRYLAASSTLTFETVNKAWCKYNGEWSPLTWGIDPELHYNIKDPDAGDQGYPITNYRWDATQGKFELWPVPDQDGTILLRGTKALDPLTSDAHMSTLDGTLIVLFAAAGYMADTKPELAAPKANKAAAYLDRLKVNQTTDKRAPLPLNVPTGGRFPSYPKYIR